MRKLSLLIFLLLFMFQASPSPICNAAPESLTLYTFRDGEPELNLTADLFGLGRPLTIHITKQEQLIAIRVYDQDKPIAGIFRPNEGQYAFYKARLKDSLHEEVIVLAINPVLHSLGDLFILGVDSEGDIAPLPLLRPLKRYPFVSTTLSFNRGIVSLPFLSPYDTPLTLCWDATRQVFALSESLRE